MNFADTLKKRSADSGKKTIQGKEREVEQTRETTMEGFASRLKSNKVEKEAADAVIPTANDLGPVDKWSFSGLKDFERCPQAVKLNKVDRVKQKQGEAAERGSLIHDMCEHYVRGQIPMLVPDKKTKFEAFAQQFSELKVMFKEQTAGAYPFLEMEENWGIRLDWSGCSWEDDELWGRGKLDGFVRESETSCRIIDYKTGRKFGNEMKHADQGLSYALYAYHRFNKEIEHFTVEFWYLDQGETTVRSYSARQLEILQPRYHKRAIAMTTEKQFRPKSNADTCRFCAYGANKSKKGVQYGVGACKNDFYRAIEDEHLDPTDEEGLQDL